MKSTITFRRDSKNVKNRAYLKNGVFSIYAPKQLKISLMQLKDTTQKLPLLYRKILVDFSLQNLKQMKLNKFVAIHNGFG